MGINPSQLAAQEISTVTDFAIQITYSRITHMSDAPAGATAGSLIGYFNATTNRVELYCVSAAGRKYIRVM